MRVSQLLAENQVAFETVVHPPAYTAQKLAHFLHIPGKQVIKSVLLASGKGFFLAVLPATRKVDLEAVQLHLETDVRLANEEEMASLFSDCERGALAPFGQLYGIRTLLDDSLTPDTLIVFESQHHFLAIRMLCRDFEAIERPQRVALGK